MTTPMFVWRWADYVAQRIRFTDPVTGCPVETFLRPLEADFLFAVVVRHKAPIPQNDLAETVYGDCPNGGPLDIAGVFGVMAVRINKLLPPGYRLVSRQCRWSIEGAAT